MPCPSPVSDRDLLTSPKFGYNSSVSRGVYQYGPSQQKAEAMTYKGVARERIIELDELLPYPQGQALTVVVQPLHREAEIGSPERVRSAMHALPHLDPMDVDDLETCIKNGRLPVRDAESIDPEPRE